MAPVLGVLLPVALAPADHLAQVTRVAVGRAQWAQVATVLVIRAQLGLVTAPLGQLLGTTDPVRLGAAGSRRRLPDQMDPGAPTPVTLAVGTRGDQRGPVKTMGGPPVRAAIGRVVLVPRAVRSVRVVLVLLAGSVGTHVRAPV